MLPIGVLYSRLSADVNPFGGKMADKAAENEGIYLFYKYWHDYLWIKIKSGETEGK